MCRRSTYTLFLSITKDGGGEWNILMGKVTLKIMCKDKKRKRSIEKAERAGCMVGIFR